MNITRISMWYTKIKSGSEKKDGAIENKLENITVQSEILNFYKTYL